MAKRSELMKIMAVSLVLLFLISGFSVMVYGPISANKTIKSPNSSNSISFSNLYFKHNVTFKERGIPSETSSTNATTFSEQNRTYFYPISSVSQDKVLTSFGTKTIKRETLFSPLVFLNSSNVVYPYLYPVYNNYQIDLEDHKSVISGLEYEAFQIESNGSLDYFGDSGVTSTLLNISINAYPMIVNNYQISNVENLIYNVNNVQKKFINDAISYALNNGYSGYSIDFEPPSGSDFSQNDAYYFVQFLNNFSNALHHYNLKLFVAIDPAYNGVPNSELFYYIGSSHFRVGSFI